MARSIALKRSKSSTRSAAAATGVARRRPPQEDSSVSDSSSTARKDAPYRNLRKRVSLEGLRANDEMDDRKPAAKNTQGRKRSAAACAPDNVPPSTMKAGSNSKKSRTSITIATSTDDTNFARAPLTRAMRKMVMNQVTPSPAQASASPIFTFKLPPSKWSPDWNESNVSLKVPEGVVDLYPATRSKLEPNAHTCSCDQETCSSRALSGSFIQVYGHEFYSSMKKREEPIVSPGAHMPSQSPSHESQGSSNSHQSDPSNSSSRVFHSPAQEDRDDDDDDNSSVPRDGTPNFRRVWGHLDTGNLSAVKAVESSKFLDYQPELTPKMRSILMDWIIELSEHFNFGPSTLHLACTLVDQVLACGPLCFDNDEETAEDDGEESKTNCFLICREKFQLLGATCTWLACKMEEQSPPKVSQIAYVSDNIYSVEQIKRMERRICTALDFSLARQTPYPYIHEFMRASCECIDPGCESPPVFKHMVLYLLEIGRLPFLPVTKKPSLLAAAAVYLARVTLGIGGGEWTSTLEHYTGYTKEDLKDVVLCLHDYQMAAEDSSLKSVFDKYRAKKYRRVALKTVPLRENLGF